MENETVSVWSKEWEEYYEALDAYAHRFTPDEKILQRMTKAEQAVRIKFPEFNNSLNDPYD